MPKNGSDVSLTGDGNTSRPPSSKRWCFTLNNYNEKEYIDIINYLDTNGSNKYIIGKEVGESGTPHLQGYINFEKKCRPLENKHMNKRIHWEKCKGSEKDNIKYCSKDGKFIKKDLFVPRPVSLLKLEEMYHWQRYVVDIVCQVPDDRTIYWFWDAKGKRGKTWLAKYLAVKHNGIPVEGKKNDILYCAAMHDSDLYIFDFERSMEEYISYGGIEKIKNGFFLSPKYKSEPVTRACPHVICFANFEPDKEQLSKDRWNIINLKKFDKVINNISKEDVKDVNHKFFKLDL